MGTYITRAFIIITSPISSYFIYRYCIAGKLDGESLVDLVNHP